MANQGRDNGRGKDSKSEDKKPGLILYQCKAIFEGAPERFELSVNKNDTVKVVDKQDHGELIVYSCACVVSLGVVVNIHVYIYVHVVVL